MQPFISKFLTVCLLVISCNFSYAQFGVAGEKKSRSEYCFPFKLEENDYKKLKKCTTYFVCPKNLLKDEEELQKVLDEAWDYTEIKVIGQDDVKDYISKKNSAFFNVGLLISTVSIQEIYMELSCGADDNKIRFARFNLNFDCKMQEIFKKQGSDELFNYINAESEIINLKPGIIANYLRLIETKLKAMEFVDCQSKISNKDELKDLENDTLYITDNVKTKFLLTAFKFGCETDEEYDIEKIMAKYPHPYKLISFDELSDKIINGDDFYYTICLKSQDNIKHVSIFKSKSGECIYNNTSQGAQFKVDDFDKIAKLISK